MSPETRCTSSTRSTACAIYAAISPCCQGERASLPFEGPKPRLCRQACHTSASTLTWESGHRHTSCATTAQPRGRPCFDKVNTPLPLSQELHRPQ